MLNELKCYVIDIGGVNPGYSSQLLHEEMKCFQECNIVLASWGRWNAKGRPADCLVLVLGEGLTQYYHQLKQIDFNAVLAPDQKCGIKCIIHPNGEHHIENIPRFVQRLLDDAHAHCFIECEVASETGKASFLEDTFNWVRDSVPHPSQDISTAKGLQGWFSMLGIACGKRADRRPRMSARPVPTTRRLCNVRQNDDQAPGGLSKPRLAYLPNGGFGRLSG